MNFKHDLAKFYTSPGGDYTIFYMTSEEEDILLFIAIFPQNVTFKVTLSKIVKDDRRYDAYKFTSLHVHDLGVCKFLCIVPALC